MLLHSLTFSRDTALVLVTATTSELQHLTRAFTPYLEVPSTSTPQAISWHVSGAVPTERSSLEVVVVSEPGQPQYRLLISRTRRLIVVDHPAGAWRALFIERLVRHLVRLMLGSQGELFLHAGLVVDALGGVAVMGDKRAGKTTSILALTAAHGLAFAANDDVSISAVSESPVGRGWPRALSIRSDSLEVLFEAIPTFAEAPVPLSHPRNAGLILRRATRDYPDHVFVRPSELAVIAPCRVAAEAPLRAVLLPRFVAEGEPIRVERLGQEQATEALESCLQEPTAGRAEYLSTLFARPGSAAVAARVRLLAARLPCFRLYQPFTEAVQGTAVALEAVRRTCASTHG